MRIAFVGKGGSGKTTLTALFGHYLGEQGKRAFLFDADLNAHLAHHFGLIIPSELHLSLPDNQRNIRTILRGTNPRIRELSHFRKTTPPGKGSYIIRPDNISDPILARYGIDKESLRFYVVGSYSMEEIGLQCYHNNLAILENILSHSYDKDELFVVDMVAGTDAFASSLYLQFDLIVFVLEPTWESLEVLRQYTTLAAHAGIAQALGVVGNKVMDNDDARFIEENSLGYRYLGNIPFISALRRKAPETILELLNSEPEILELFQVVLESLLTNKVSHNTRLHSLYRLHKEYVAQAFIRERFGDLADQIDTKFSFSL